MSDMVGLAGTKTNTKIKKRHGDFRRWRISYFMLAPYALIFIIFTLIPVLVSIFFSFTYFNMLQVPRWIGLSNFLRLFLDDDVFLISIRNTLLLAVITGPVGYILSFIFAWLINEFGPKVRSLLTLIFYAPTLSGSVVYMMWKYLFDGDSYGFVNSRLLMLGIIKEPIPWLTDPRYNLWIVIIVTLWMSAGAGFLSFVAGLQMINREYYEAGAIDGIKNRWQELWYITLPLMKPQLLLGAVFSISGAFGIGYVNMNLTGFPSTDYSTHTILLHILDFGFYRYEMGYASAIQIVLFFMMLLSWYIINKLFSKISYE